VLCEARCARWLLITPGFIGRDIIDIVRLINRRKLNGTARAASFPDVFTKVLGIDRAHRMHRTRAAHVTS